MIESATSASSIAAMLKTLQSHSTQATGQGFDLPGTAPTPKTDFSDLVRQAVSQTNASQVDAQNTAQSFERGEAVPPYRRGAEDAKSLAVL